jgi:response regulator RpfG family c-di-GMP phosphodiesterase
MSTTKRPKVVPFPRNSSRDDVFTIEGDEVATRLARIVELKDHPNSGHTVRVGRLSALVAQALGMHPDDVKVIGLASQLHDIGKLGISDEILFNDQPLSLEQMDVIKTHTVLGAALLAGSSSPVVRMAEVIALYHHENWNGTGYTPGLEGEGIPLVGRIVRVTDSFDAMTMRRAFAEQWRREAAVEFIQSQAGHQFDPRVVAALVDVIAESLR